MTGLDGLRVLVLGAGALHETAFLGWARHGCRTTLVDGEQSSGYEPLVDEYLPYPVYDDQDPDLDRLAALAARHDVVLTLSEMAQVTTAAVAGRAGRTGTGLAAARLARDKHRQRELTGGVRSVLVDGPAPGGLPMPPPWVVKPLDSGGSAAVTLVERVADLAPACERATAQSVSGRCVIEEFVPGREWSVELLVTGGRIRYTAYTAKTLVGPDCFVERRHVVGPRPEPEAAFTALAARMVRTYEVDTAICHLEVRVDGDRVTPIEMAVRPAGDGLLELVRLSQGRDLYAELVAHLAGRSAPEPCEPVAPYAGVEFLVATGTVARTPRPADIVDPAAGIRYAVTTVREGVTLPPLDANWSRAGRVVGVGGSAATLERALDAATATMAAEMGVTRI